MSANNDQPGKDRRTTRLAGHDYGRTGAYFLTLCVRHRECYLGLIRHGNLKLSVLGEIGREEWARTPAIRPGIVLDAFVVMPNHLHAVLAAQLL
ncbi:MAG TPA: hypothetical protein VNL71_02780 [Chloroflexota bacterium]|nr:hypothetical protein [Chloroflexota bacterium]HVC80167.1 hypothetical protein [Chloroflexota bacterium]